MITYAALRLTPQIFPALTGLTREEFDRLVIDFVAARDHRRAASTHTKRGRPRRRAAGAGAPATLDLPDRLLMTLLWLRVYPTYEVLGWLFGLEKSNAWENVQDTLAVLETLADFAFERPAAERAKLRTPQAVFDAFPQVKVILDGKEQPFRRPRGWDQQKPFYSGKKKRHTVKNQVVCTPEGRIGGVGATVPGSTHDLTMMRGDGVLDRLAAGEGAMADKAYTGAQDDCPGVPLVVPAKATRGHPLSAEQESANRAISGCRVVIEHVMAQLNRFQVLKQVFRSGFGRHTRAIRVVAALVDRRIAVVPLRTFAAT
jgi:DDE superfamily endonuclease/Helix-turn-helix of DDE superfamily endonuclease